MSHVKVHAFPIHTFYSDGFTAQLSVSTVSVSDSCWEWQPCEYKQPNKAKELR